jgi:type IV secretion system protein VirB10
MKNSNNLNNDYDEDINRPEIDTGLSEVAVSPKKNIITLAIIGVFSLILVYFLFFRDTPLEQKKKEKQELSEVSNKIKTTQPAKAEIDTPITLPKLPEPPPLVVPPPPPPPAPPPPAPPPVSITTPVAAMPPQLPLLTKDDNAKIQALAARKKSTIMLGGAGGTKDNNIGSGDHNDYFEPVRTTATQSKATSIGNTSFMIAQGKMIDAVLETAINTDLPGTIRAMVSRDVYAESGKNILIPKGSRLIGAYQSNIQRGQKRVAIKWSRIIRADGIDIAIDKSDAVDKLGRVGVEGYVDNKYFEIFSNAILLSVINVGLALGVEKVTNFQATPQTTITTPSTTGALPSITTTASGKPSDAAIQDAVKSLGDAGKKITQDALNVNPTITVNQGYLIKVFVNQDLIFPAHIANGIKVVK